MRPSLIASTPLLAALAWTVALILDPGPFSSTSVFLVGMGLLGSASVAVVGVVVAGGRWAHRLALATLAATIVVALARPIDLLWVAGLAITTLAGVSLFMPAVLRGVRRLPAATGPPARAVIVPLLLIAAPFLLGVTPDATGWPEVVVGLTAPLTAFAFARVIPGGLVAIRLVWPGLAVGLAPFMGWPTATVSILLGVTTAFLAWSGEVKVAYHPPRETGSTFRIAPELAPRDVLDAADIDDTGRRR